MVTICGNASVFKTQSQAELENYSASLANMKKIVALLYHDSKWHTEENICERYESSIIPRSKLHRFMHSAHEPQIEETEEFNRIVTEFLLG